MHLSNSQCWRAFLGVFWGHLYFCAVSTRFPCSCVDCVFYGGWIIFLSSLHILDMSLLSEESLAKFFPVLSLHLVSCFFHCAEISKFDMNQFVDSQNYHLCTWGSGQTVVAYTSHMKNLPTEKEGSYLCSLLAGLAILV